MDTGAAPVTQSRACESPNPSFTFEYTSLSKSLYCATSTNDAPRPAAQRATTVRPRTVACSTSLALTPWFSPTLSITPAWNFSHTRGTPKNMVAW